MKDVVKNLIFFSSTSKKNVLRRFAAYVHSVTDPVVGCREVPGRELRRGLSDPPTRDGLVFQTKIGEFYPRYGRVWVLRVVIIVVKFCPENSSIL